MIIYKATNKTNGMIYIGQTSRSLKQRMAEHLAFDRTSYFDRSLKKYGIDAFTIEIIDVANSKEELDEKEKYYINFYKSKAPHGYNLTDGGEGQVGVRRFGKDNPNYGNHYSKEARLKISNTRKKYTKDKHPMSKKVLNLDTGEVFDCMRLACEKYNLDPSTLTKVCERKRKTCGGYRWSYERE